MQLLPTLAQLGSLLYFVHAGISPMHAGLLFCRAAQLRTRVLNRVTSRGWLPKPLHAASMPGTPT